MTPHVSISLLRTQTDERLVELTAAGHDRAFDAIVDRYRRPLLRYAHRFLKEDGRAEDVVQAALVSAWTALREGTTVRDLRPWLYRIVHNGALNAMKKPGSEDAPLIEASDTRLGPEAAVEQREDVRRALDTIASLPDRQRAALLAVALEGRSHAAVGEDLGINDTAVRQLVRRARASLRVAATAVTPWPVAVWMAGIGGPQAVDSAARVGEVVGGVGAGTLFGGTALKAGALVAATGALAVSAPQVAHMTGHHRRPAQDVAQAAQTGGGPGDPGPGGGSSLRAATIGLAGAGIEDDGGAAGRPAGGSGHRSRGVSGTLSGGGEDGGRSDDSGFHASSGTGSPGDAVRQSEDGSHGGSGSSDTSGPASGSGRSGDDDSRRSGRRGGREDSGSRHGDAGEESRGTQDASGRRERRQRPARTRTQKSRHGAQTPSPAREQDSASPPSGHGDTPDDAGKGTSGDSGTSSGSGSGSGEDGTSGGSGSSSREGSDDASHDDATTRSAPDAVTAP